MNYKPQHLVACCNNRISKSRLSISNFHAMGKDDDEMSSLRTPLRVGRGPLGGGPSHEHSEPRRPELLHDDPVFRLKIQNFRIVEEDFQTWPCRVEPTESMDIDKITPAEVDADNLRHRVLNLAEFDCRAVSLHIYSQPIDRYLAYSPSENQCREVVLSYTSQYGKLCAGVWT